MACHIKALPHKIQTRVLHQLLLQKNLFIFCIVGESVIVLF